MKTTVVLALLFSGTARWTGRSERVTLYDHSQGIKCQYRDQYERMFWQAFHGTTCPETVDVP